MSQMGEAQAPLRFSETTRLAGKVLLSISTDLHESIIQISIFFNCNIYIYRNRNNAPTEPATV